MTRKLAIGIGLLGLVSLACNASTLIGDARDASSVTNSAIGAGGSGMCTPPVDPNDQPFTPPTAVAGTWTGYFEGSSLPVGADAIELTIDQASDGSNQIHLVLGSDPPPAPATVATDPYPADLLSNPALFGRPNRTYLDGFSYPAHEVQWFGQRLKFVFEGWEAWDSWCLLQQSFKYTQEDNDYSFYNCVPGGGGSSHTTADGGQECYASLDSHGTTTPIDCDQLAMCQPQTGPCECDECGCSKNLHEGMAFDITFDGDVATGTGSLGPLHLTRATN
jgi:hypothetical protein